MVKRGNEKSLSRIFLTVVILTYALTLSIGLLAFYRIAAKISDYYVRRYTSSQCSLEKNRLLSIIQREVALSQKLANDPVLHRWINDENNPVLRSEAVEQMDSYYLLFNYKTYFLGVLSSRNYYNRGVNMEVMESKILTMEDPGDRWFFDAVKKNLDYALNVNYDYLLDEVRVWINTTVRNKSGEPVGVTGTGIDLTHFLDSLVVHEAPGISTVIINPAGEIQAHRDRAVVQHNGRAKSDAEKITLFQLLNPDDSVEEIKQMIKNAISSGRMQVERLHIEGSDSVVAMNYIAELDWLNMVIVNTGAIIGIRDFLPLAAVFLFSALLSLFALIMLLNRFILKPLSSFSAAVDVVAAGAYNIELPEEGSLEIAHLGRSFNNMTSQICNYTRNLQEMVDERTFELSEANRNLSEAHQKLAEDAARLKELNAVKDRFLSILSHDLKAPLNSIFFSIGYFLNNEKRVDESELREFLNLLKEDATATLSLLDQLLLWGKNQSEGLLTRKERLNANELIQACLSVQKGIADKKDIKLLFEEVEPVFIVADRDMISTVIRNLLSNATKFSKKGGSVEISCRKTENSEVIITVKDSGVGMYEHDLQNLFRLDSMFSKPGTGEEKGSGFGLILCKELMEKNNGRISVESTLGQGTEFYLFLPDGESMRKLQE